MRDLAEATRQANQLVVFDRGNPVVVAQQEAPGYWGISIRVGSRIGLLDTGSGHVLLAFRDQEERERMIAEHLGNRAEGWGIDAAYFERLERVRGPRPRAHAERPDGGRHQSLRAGAGCGWQGRGGADHSLPAAHQCGRCPDMEGAVASLEVPAGRFRSCRAQTFWPSDPGDRRLRSLETTVEQGRYRP